MKNKIFKNCIKTKYSSASVYRKNLCYRTLANKQFELNFREFFFEYMLIDFNIQSITLLSHYRRYLYSTDSYLYFITIWLFFPMMIVKVVFQPSLFAEKRFALY